MIPYEGRDYQSRLQIDPRLLAKGYTNLSRVEASGRANFINWLATFHSNQRAWSVKLGDGSIRSYKRSMKLNQIKRQEMYFPTDVVYLLTEEQKPNGNKIKFDYCLIDGKPKLEKVETVNRMGKTINNMNFSYNANQSIVTSGTNGVIYLQKNKRASVDLSGSAINKTVLQNVHSSKQGVTNYTTEDGPVFRIVRVDKPNHYFLKIEYNKNNQVKRLLEPLGKNNQEIQTYRFEYEENDTKVFNALGQLNIYNFDTNHRLRRIDYLDEKQVIRQDVFEWSQKPEEKGWLRSKSVRLKDAIYYLKNYEYDERGNITKQTLYGNLTGNKAETFSRNELNQVDQYRIEYQYYPNNDFNLISSKKTPEGLEILYGYLEGTNLCTQEYHIYQGKIQERFFYAYDENGQLVSKVEDDGSSPHENDLTDVTYRRVKAIITETNSTLPSFGKPIQITEFCLNLQNAQMILLKRTDICYDSNGNEWIRRVYNDQNILCYETSTTYDARQRLIEKVNPIGQATRYEYDDNHNKIREELVGSGKYTIFIYDAGNRLKFKQEFHTNGDLFVTEYKYNALNQLIAEKDPYGNTTTYEYDCLGRQTSCVKPTVNKIANISITPTLVKEYNILDQMISKIDENGFKTVYSYNIYGKPTKIIHPDGAVESYLYYPCGWLKQHIRADGASTQYEYDPKGRVTKEIVFDQNGAIVKTEEYVYKGVLLSCKKDALNIKTTYQYDGAGRKISENIGNMKFVLYEYDSLGRVCKIWRPLSNKNGQIEVYQYDALDRVILKTWQDYEGKIYAGQGFVYDINGHVTHQANCQAEGKIPVERFEYDSHGNLLWQENALGQRTSWSYFHQNKNGLNQYVQNRRVEDALGGISLEADDALHRLVLKDDYSEGRKVSSTDYSYDEVGRLIKTHSLIMQDGRPLREYTLSKSYTSRGYLATEIEMGKTTSYRYNQMGQVIQKIKPDGMTINYAYDSLGRLIAMASLDGRIAYQYTYDLHDNLIEVKDLYYGLVQKRTYDLLDRLLVEELSSGVTIHYAYDALDRLTRMVLPDGSYVDYEYDAYHLKKIQRFKALNQLDYEYECQSYDMAGNLLKSIAPAGTITYDYDLLNRKVHIYSPSWESHLEQFDPVGNLLTLKQKDPTGEFQASFAYDRFNQLMVESAPQSNLYVYDSIGNCVWKNHLWHEINGLNQITNDGFCQYAYDANGNLIAQSNPAITYQYDALNRLVCCEEAGMQTHFIYDSFGRCLFIGDASGLKQLLYQKDQEIGVMQNGQVTEFRLTHPDANKNMTFAIELKGEAYFPIQDHRYNICALQKRDGSLAEWYRYSAFGAKTIYNQNNETLFNPWRFANRREVVGLSLFAKRFYNPTLMRWQTTDPLGFEDGLNLYRYVRNNPFTYIDEDGQVAVFLIPVICGAFGAGGAVLSAPTIGTIVGTAVMFALSWETYEVYKWYNAHNQIETEEKQNEIETDQKNEIENKGRPKKEIRTEPKNLAEQLTLEEAKALPETKEIMEDKIKDPRYPKESWKKCQHIHYNPDGTNINIHFWENRYTQEKHSFKFKDD